MIQISEIQRWAARGEGQFMEFKKKADHPEKIVKELVAFANSGGGNLLLGVNDNGSVPGLKFPDEEAYVMEAAIYQYSKPIVPFKMEKVKIPGGNSVLVYKVIEGTNKPYQWLLDKENGLYKVMVRSGEQSIQASREMIRILKSDPTDAEGSTLQLNQLERRIFNYLADNECLTLLDLARIGKVAPWKAANKLVYLVRCGVLRVEPAEGGDRFFLEEKYKHLHE